MKASRLLALVLAAALPALCSAQWRWIDKNGQAVFSDQPPPSDVPPGKIIRQPGARSRTAPEAAAPAEPASRPAQPPRVAASGASSAKAPGGKDKELQEKKKQVEAAEEEKKKAQEEENARLRADNCTRAKQSKASFDSGVRITRMNDKGEREVLDDAQRASEVKRLEAVIARDCKPAAGN